MCAKLLWNCYICPDIKLSPIHCNMKEKVRRTYDKEFKLMVVNLCLSGKKASEVASEMDLDRSMVQRWVRQYQQNDENCFGGNGNLALTPEQEEIANLKKELREVKIERDILKKAVCIFSKSDSKNLNS